MKPTAEPPPSVSIVVPVFNEAANLRRLHQRITASMERTSYPYELVLVDDGSQDDSLAILLELKAGDDRLHIVQLTRNFGQHPALAAGFAVSTGQSVVTLDADLQIDPKYIPTFLQALQKGIDFVSGIRVGQGDSWFFRRLPSRFVNLLIGRVAGKPLRDYGCPMNAMTAEIAKALPDYGEMQRFFKPLAVRLCRRAAEVEVQHRPRIGGKSKYNWLALVDLFFDFVTNFSKQVFQRIALAGLALAGSSTITGLAYLSLRLILGIPAMERLIWLLFLSFSFGLNLLILGVLGDFVIRIYRKLTPQPIFEIRQQWPSRPSSARKDSTFSS